MTVGCRVLALQDSSGKRQEWISLQLQPLKLTGTTTKLRVYVCFQRRVRLSHVWEKQLAFLDKLRHGDLDGFSMVLLTQFSTTKSKSTLIPGSKSKFSPKPLHSFSWKARFPPPPSNMDHTLDISLSFANGSSDRNKMTQRNRQRLLSTWLAHRQEKHLSQDWTQGESKHTLSICSDTKPACRRARLSL